ncbi:hypothetical protein COOONC_00295 [Cooperia oncophora]
MSEFEDVFVVADSELSQTKLVVYDIDTGRAKAHKTRRGQRKTDLPEPELTKENKTRSLDMIHTHFQRLTQYYSVSGKKVLANPLSEEANRKSASTTSEGLYQFTVWPFGLLTNSTVFQRVMDMVLKGLTLEEDVTVLGALSKVNLVKSKEVCRIPPPKSVAKIHAGFSKLTKCRHSLTRPKNAWKWTNEELASLIFEQSIDCRSSAGATKYECSGNGTRRPFGIHMRPKMV